MFQLPDSEPVDFVRLYVGTEPGVYETTIDLAYVDLGGGIGVATDAGLARILTQPGVYFFALTAIDLAGRESVLSNELRVERT